MSSLYIYDFGDEQYRVDDSGEQWKDAMFGPKHTVFCESCYDEVTEALENEHGTIMCLDCFDIVPIDLTTSEGDILLDKGHGHYQVVPTLAYSRMEVTERHEDGVVIMNQVGDYSMWRDITLGGVLHGYSFMGDIDDPEEDDGLEDWWVDSRSVTCHCCGNMADERETYCLTGDSGDICPSCYEAMQCELEEAKKSLVNYTHEVQDFDEDTDIIRELTCRLVQRKLETIVQLAKNEGAEAIAETPVLFKDDPRE